METIKRSEFVDIVEWAINARLAPDDAAALRKVARTTKLVGSNFNTDPACPATQAVGASYAATSTAVSDFAFKYDNLIRVHFKTHARPTLIKVVD